MNWTAGYASDVEYVTGYYREQSPTLLEFVCVLNDIEPPVLDGPFCYCELGFGRGLTVNVLAAAHPEGRFYAVDFNPAHVAGARAMAQEADLANLSLLEASFADLANGNCGELPQFDFITLHGIYTWVTAENQQYITEFIARHLKPGGVVYVSYNALPGWAAAMPLQRLMVEYGDAYPNRSDEQIKEARKLIGDMAGSGAAYFALNPGLKPRLDALAGANPSYLVHEYMHKHWAPRYHADVARDLAAAKLEFVGSTDLALTYPALFLSAEKLRMVDTMKASPMRETLIDYFRNTAFRTDVFVRGARRLSAHRHRELLRRFGLALIVPASEVRAALKLSIGEISLKEELIGPVLDALASGPKTIAELWAVPALAKEPPANLAQVAALLTAAKYVELFVDSGLRRGKDAALRLNRSLAASIIKGVEHTSLCSPVLGTALSTGYIDRLVYHVLPDCQGAPEVADVTRRVWQIVASLGRRMVKDGLAIETEEGNLAEIERQVRGVLEHSLPRWRQLNMI